METIVAINESNILSIAELSVELWPDSSLDEMVDHYKVVLQADGATCLLLQNGSGAMGFIELSMRHDYVEGAYELPVAYIEGLYVREAYRHKSWARQLVAQAEHWAREKGLRQLCSDTILENEASINFHVKAGFEEAARIVCFAKNLY